MFWDFGSLHQKPQVPYIAIPFVVGGVRDGCDVAASFLTRCRGSRYFCQSRCGDALSLSVAADAIRIRLEAVISDHVAITKETCSDIGVGTLILC